jgi:uncharacterized protein (DUF1499 family)
MKLIKKIGLAAIGAAAAGIAVLAILNPDTSAQTSADHKNEKMRPRKYKTSLENFVAETVKIIPAQTTYGQNWKLVSSSSDKNSALIKAEVPVLVFTDDLEIRAESGAETGEITVNVYSALRVGLNDWGENRRHVLQILEALDAEFSE